MKTVIPRSQSTVDLYFRPPVRPYPGNSPGAPTSALKESYLRRYDELWDLSTLYYIVSELYSMIQGRTPRCTGVVRAYRRFILSFAGSLGSGNNRLHFIRAQYLFRL